jgi:hypothetical protein
MCFYTSVWNLFILLPNLHQGLEIKTFSYCFPIKTSYINITYVMWVMFAAYVYNYKIVDSSFHVSTSIYDAGV